MALRSTTLCFSGPVFDFQLFSSVIVTLLVIMNPPGVVPIFLALTGTLTHKQRVVAARRASLVALGVIATFAVFGQQILTYLNIGLPALQGPVASCSSWWRCSC